MIINPLLLTDSYKLTHPQMQKALTNGSLDYLYSNFTPRKSRLDGVEHVVFFGLQHWLVDLQESFDSFFTTPLKTVIDDYKKNVETFVNPGFSVDHIKALHKLGYLPLEFKALREGTLSPIRVPQLTVTNTVKGFGWLVNYLETWLSTGIWHPSTSATISWRMRQLLDDAAERTSDTPEAVLFQSHDFSFRGMENWQAAAASSAGHLLSFLGSDTVPVVPWVNKYYPGDNGLIAASVPATEHSIMCLNGKESEEETYKTLIDEFPSGILSVVSDTWDLFNVIKPGGILDRTKDAILSRDGKLVIRPDSGNPVDIVAGSVIANDLLPQGTPEQKGVVETLWDVFGGTVNSKGFKVLDSHVGVIYGDSITYDIANTINRRLEAKGFDTTNVVFGSGSFTYQYVTRDTFSSAIKATQATINGVTVDLQKDPVTDSGTKKSAKGQLAVLSDMSGKLYTVEQADEYALENSHLKTVWKDGKFVLPLSYADVRAQVQLSTEILKRNGSI